MIRIHLNTGLVWTKSIDVEGDLRSDLLGLIDDYYRENGDLPVRLYTIGDLQEIYEDEEELERELENMIPINGGEYYIDGISSVEEI